MFLCVLFFYEIGVFEIFAIENLERFTNMAADFGEAEYILTKYMKHQMLVCESNEYPQNYYLFEKKSGPKQLANGSISVYYECRGCALAVKDHGDEYQNPKKKRVMVTDEQVVSNPNIGHLQHCQLITKAELEVTVSL